MSDRREELDELLVRRALEGLDAAATRRLNRLLEAHPDVDSGWADRVVGELDAGAVDDDLHPLDVEFRRALVDAGLRVAPDGAERRAAGTGALRPTPSGPGVPAAGARWTAWGGWALAAALAGLLLVRGGAAPPPGGEVVPTPAPTQVAGETGGGGRPAEGPAPTFGALAATADAVTASWTPGGHDAGDGVTGAVVWSGAAQAGAMRFAGLAPNPAGLQYQLWIFDAERDERFPVDGGVFDVPPGPGVVEVPIDARLPVADPTLFAVTLEPAGGVVVSDRTRLAVVAPVDG
jgi:hypothetical protein